MAARTMKGLGCPLGLFSNYSHHQSELSIKIREKDQHRLEILTSDGRLYMSVVGRDKKILFDNRGRAILNVRNKTLDFRGEYQTFEGDADRLPLFTIRNKWSVGGPKLVANFVNFDDKPVELQVRGNLLSGDGKIKLNDQHVARFEAGILEPTPGRPGKFDLVSRMTVAPLVDVAMAVALLVCLQDISTED